MTADVLPASNPDQCHEVLIKAGTFTITISATDAHGDRAHFSAEIS